ncbi:M48 family metalloprotease [Streptomyces sp. NPDC001070]
MNPRTSPGRRRSSAAAEWSLAVAMTAVAWSPWIGAALVLGSLAVFWSWGPWSEVGLPALWVMSGLTQAAGRARAPLPGRAVRPGDQPELTALVEDVAERIGFRAPLLVRIVPEPNAALGPARVSGVRGHVLLLGLPLLRTMTSAQVAAVVAHELAHEREAHDRRSVLLMRARAGLQERLEGRLGLLTPLVAPLLRASGQRAWETELAADAASVRIVGVVAVRGALERTSLLDEAFHGLGERWFAELAEDDAYPEDFYAAFDAALRDPHVARRSARLASGATDPYGLGSHPPIARRLAALPDAGDEGPDATEPVTLRGAGALERWCVRELAGLGGHEGAGDPPGAPRPVRLLGPDGRRVPGTADGSGPLREATGVGSAAEAVMVALDAVAQGDWHRLARRVEPGLRWVPRAERPFAARAVLIGSVAEALAEVLRGSGWRSAGRWMSTVLTAPDGTVLDLHDALAAAVDGGDPAALRVLLRSAATTGAAA